MEGVLSNGYIQQPILLDIIKKIETGHLSPEQAAVAVSPKDARGPYQFLSKNLNNMGYGMPQNISLEQVQDATTARALAGKYVDGYTQHHGFTNAIQQLAAYNMGPQRTADWLAAGGRFEDLPSETQNYINSAVSIYNGKKNMTSIGLQTFTGGADELSLEDDWRTGSGSGVFVYKENHDRYWNQPVSPEPTDAKPASPQTDDNWIFTSAHAADITPHEPAPGSWMEANRQGWTMVPNPVLNQDFEPYKIGYNPPVNNAATNNQITTPPVVAGDGQGSAPILSDGQTGDGMLASTNGRRDNVGLSTQRPPRMGLGEMLFRAGGAGVAGSQFGGLNAIGAATKEAGAVIDAQRSAGLEAYKASMKGSEDAAGDVAGYDATLGDFERAVQFLEKGGLTGPIEGTLGNLWDGVVGNEEAGKRLLLEKLRVDDALLRIAQTKGAISNKEMDLFLAPSPSMWQSEEVWLNWARRRIEALRNVRNRLAVSSGMPSVQGTSPSAPAAGGGDVMSEADKIVGISQ